MERWEVFSARIESMQQQKIDDEIYVATTFDGLGVAISFLDYDCNDNEKPNIVQLVNSHEIVNFLRENEIGCHGINTKKQLFKALQDCHDDILSVEDLQQYRKRQQDAKRQELEEQASAIAQKYNCSVNSLEFLDACQQELERFRNYRESMQGDGFCIGWGVTQEQWYEEFTDSLGDSGKIQKIIDWVTINMPLLYGQWQYQLHDFEQDDSEIQSLTVQAIE